MWSEVPRRRKKINDLHHVVNEETELELIRTILGEEVSTDILLQCLTNANFDVATAVNLYFAGLSTDVDVTKSIRSGMPITLHEPGFSGMLGKSDVDATMTKGLPTYDSITPTNEKYKVVRLRKRSGSLGQYFRNGDVISIECHGLWLKGSKVSKAIHWKSPCDDDRTKFVVRGLPPGQWITIDTPFCLSSYKWKNRFVCKRDDNRSLMGSPINMNIHRCVLGLDKVYTESNLLYLIPGFTARAMETIPRPGDAIVAKSTDSEPPHRESIAISEAKVESDFKIQQMCAIIGEESKEKVVKYLDGAGGNVQIALEHYFMQQTENKRREKSKRMSSRMLIPMEDRGGGASRSLDGSHVHDAYVSEKEGAIGKIDESKSEDPLCESSGVSPSSMVEQGVKKRGLAKSRPISHEINLTIEDFEMLSVLGRGSFGAVMMVRYKLDGRIFAIKILKKTNMDSNDISNAIEERQILQRVNHPYISTLVFAFQTNERLYLGMKYYAAGDLFYHLNERGRLPIAHARLYAAELVSAITYLHELNILYRDLKPSNIMIDSEGHIGLVDFGLSKQHIYGSSHGVKTLSGTAEYVAPEALVRYADGNRNYGKAYDWWSFGIVMYEMIVGESPFYDENERRMLDRIVHEDAIYPSGFPQEAEDLLKGLLVREPSVRLGTTKESAAKIKAHAFFKSIDWDKLSKREIEAPWKPKLSSETDTRYVDPEFIQEGPPSAAYDPSANMKKTKSKRFSQFSFDFRLNNTQ